MDPGTLVSAGVGLIGSILGGGQPRIPNYVKRQYELLNGIQQRGIDLYDQTNLADTDAQAVSAYSDSALRRAMAVLQNYDARAAGAGSSLLKSDTAKDRSRAQIASDVGNQLGEYEAGLIASRPTRQAALLPNPSAAAAGMQGAFALDNRAIQEQAAQGGNLAAAAQLIGTLFPGIAKLPTRRTPTTTETPTRNDRDPLAAPTLGVNYANRPRATFRFAS